MSKLTAKQEALFNQIESSLRKETALEYIKGGYSSGIQAYKDACDKLNKKPAKNPSVSSTEILNYPSVKAFIDSVRVVAAEKAQIDANWILEQAVDMFKICKEAGELNTSKGFLELAGKHCDINAFKERVEVEGKVEITQITRKII